MMNKEQIIEDAKKFLDNGFSLEGKVLTFANSQTIPYYAHCIEQIRNAMIRMLESDRWLFQLTYSCLGNWNTRKAKNKKSIPNKENDKNWNNYFIVDYILIVKIREVNIDNLFQRIVNNCNNGVFLWFNEYNLSEIQMEQFENYNKWNTNNEISW
ncbi:MAG: hypothetical protein IKO56_08760 [Alphaproteobacteria bacterium]|nr:hypothetical protein [Alphaproteobacteria bacterium]